jgi:hypothetical protein
MDFVTEYHLFGADLKLILDELYSCRLWEILNRRHKKSECPICIRLQTLTSRFFREINIQNLMCSSVPIITNTSKHPKRRIFQVFNTIFCRNTHS